MGLFNKDTGLLQQLQAMLFDRADELLYLVRHSDGTGFLVGINEEDPRTHQKTSAVYQAAELLAYYDIGNARATGVLPLPHWIVPPPISVIVHHVPTEGMDILLPVFSQHDDRIYTYEENKMDERLPVNATDLKAMAVDWARLREKRLGNSVTVRHLDEEVKKWIGETRGCYTAMLIDKNDVMEIRHYNENPSPYSHSSGINLLSNWLRYGGWNEKNTPRFEFPSAPFAGHSIAALTVTDPVVQEKLQHLFHEQGLNGHIFKIDDMKSGLNEAQKKRLRDAMENVPNMQETRAMRKAAMERINRFVDDWQPAASDPGYLRQKIGALLNAKRFAGFKADYRNDKLVLEYDLSSGRQCDAFSNACDVLNVLGIKNTKPKNMDRAGKMKIFIPREEMLWLEPLFNPDWNIRRKAQEQLLAELEHADKRLTRNTGR